MHILFEELEFTVGLQQPNILLMSQEAALTEVQRADI